MKEFTNSMTQRYICMKYGTVSNSLFSTIHKAFEYAVGKIKNCYAIVWRYNQVFSKAVHKLMDNTYQIVLRKRMTDFQDIHLS